MDSILYPRRVGVIRLCEMAATEVKPVNASEVQAMRATIAEQNANMEAQARTIAKLQQANAIALWQLNVDDLIRECADLKATIKRQEAIIAKLMPATTANEKAKLADGDKHEPLHRAMGLLYGETNGWKP